MKPNRLLACVRVVLVLLTLCIAGWIFSNSLEVATVSASRSGAVTEIVNEALSQSGSEARVTEHFVRKSAHFSEYALLGAALTATVASFARALRRWYLALFLGAVTACCDELLQRFVDGRSGQLSDVLLDSFGALAGVLAASALLWLFLRLWQHRAAHHECALRKPKTNKKDGTSL